MLLHSIQVGRPREYAAGANGPEPTDGGPLQRWMSGIVKETVEGPVHVRLCNLDGDGQADLKNHGGPDKAVLAYAKDHYGAWAREVNQELPFGAFGENLTIAGLAEDMVCIGDQYAIGDVVLEVTQPRQPCWKLARRWSIPDLHVQVRETGRTGWYFRVLTEGVIRPGMSLTLRNREYPAWTVARASLVMNNPATDLATVASLAGCPQLASNWREVLEERLKKGGR